MFTYNSDKVKLPYKLAKICKIKVQYCLAIMPLFILFNTSFAQSPKHNYPLIGWQTFGGAVDDFYARYDLLVTKSSSNSFVKRLKNINPDMLIVSTTDWNTGRDIDNMPAEWWLRDSKGNVKIIYGGFKMANLSDLCPKAKRGPFSGLTYSEYLPIFLSNRIDLTYFDGVGTNGVWGRDGMDWNWSRSEWSDIDIDNNGVNDHDEHSKDWFLNHWQGGLDVLMSKLRQMIGPDKLLLINSGTSHTWGWEESNGIIDEKLTSYSEIKFNFNYYKAFKNVSKKPFITVADGLPFYGNPNVPDASKNDFIGMRFGLVTCMFNDIYFSFQNIQANEHYWSYWYDEFDVNLGKPVGRPSKIREGLWVRFFDNGAAIASTNGYSQVVTDSDLRGFSSYSGPYYRFLGSQNPSFNNGQIFDRVELNGHIQSQKPSRIFGDGILLVKEPTIVVADIIIDNSDAGTSPSSTKVKLRNGFVVQTDCNSGYDFYKLRCSSWQEVYGYAYAPPGNGEAIFRPTIGVAGEYEVFEWHGKMDGVNMATNAVYNILHSKGQDSKRVNQTTNTGRWNSLGVYHFRKGSDLHVTIQAQGADGYVMADAIKFVHLASQIEPPSPPSPPIGVRVERINN